MYFLIAYAIFVVLYLYADSRRKKRVGHRMAEAFSKSIKEKRIADESKIRGTFDVVGYHYLPDDVKSMLWYELKVGDRFFLVPDPQNKFDNSAIIVSFKGAQIGWLPREHFRKQEIFGVLLKENIFK